MTEFEKAALTLRNWFGYRIIPQDWVDDGFMDALTGMDKHVTPEMLEWCAKQKIAEVK